MNHSPTSHLERIASIDAFRGFALAGIVLIHIVEQYIAAPVPEGALPAAEGGVVNGIVKGLLFILIQGKFFALFSILFGLSFFLQMDRAKKKGLNNAGRFAWRLVLLFIIGYAHHLFYRGDILTIYAVLGFSLLAVYPLSNRWLLGLAALIFAGVFRFLVFSLNGNNPLFLDYEMSPEAPQMLHYVETLKSGSILDVFWLNATDGMLGKADFQFNIFSRGYLTVAFFLLGVWLGRIRFFQRLEELKPQLKKGLWWSIAAVVASFILSGGLFFMAGEAAMNSWLGMLAFTVFDWHNLAFTALWIIVFSLIYLRAGGQRFFDRLIPYGKTALTNYFSQSVLGTGFLYGWGLGQLGQLNNGWLLLLGLVIIIIQVQLSNWWMARYRFGPLEWLWRSLTDFRWYPLKKYN